MNINRAPLHSKILGRTLNKAAMAMRRTMAMRATMAMKAAMARWGAMAVTEETQLGQQ